MNSSPPGGSSAEDQHCRKTMEEIQAAVDQKRDEHL